MLRREKGFTLVELMVVIAIIALLAAILFPNLIAAIQKGRVAAVVSGARNLYTLMSTYYADHGYYPVKSDGTIDTTAISFNAKWPWGTETMLDKAQVVVTDDDGTYMQEGYIFWDLPKPAVKVAKEMAEVTCTSAISDKVTDAAVVIDLTGTASQSVYVCKK
jgi:prepilin-type N-terminal cleavage/methylation domain-containing protein